VTASLCYRWQHYPHWPHPSSPTAVAVWTAQSGLEFTVCQHHLDEFLDQCDDQVDLEPVRLAWLDDSRVLVGAA
jgi:hypothetical protein